jgi:uncharacterized circularly permuted ATP-grasp superfamily protein/uncharacterized alpha-E superfamily protein
MIGVDEPAPPERSPLVIEYPRGTDVYDELWSDDGRLRPHWRVFMEQLVGLGPEEMERRWQQARHLLHENGVTYNVYGDPQGVERLWSLSPLPVLIDPDEWTKLSRGIEQRARLFDALLGDLHGPGRALTGSWLPAAIVFRHPNYLRAVHGLNVPEERWLPLYAADVVRRPDGSFCVVEDRTQAPSGAGYALENRTVISSIIPEAFRECNVERLGDFFRALKDSLSSYAPHDRDNPRMVLLSSGPSNATFFEQAYLAQYLGLTLVSSGDLTVRDDRVYLKTLGGLLPVDVILRRVNDDYCDSLELRPESLLGVPGLVQAARAANVAIVNPLGSGLVQSPALLPYLPGICRQLLGEDLILPSVETHWCGESGALGEVESGFNNLVIKSAFADETARAVYTSTLAPAERAALLDRVRADSEAFVAQRYVAPSSVPTLSGDRLKPRPAVLRLYAVATRSGEYLVMPGGLARVADKPEHSISMQRGARSKDVWVLSQDQDSAPRAAPQQVRPVELSRGGSDLPSRVADNLYWLGRYAERAESVARLARVIAARLGDIVGPTELARAAEFTPLLAALTAQTQLLHSKEIPRDAAADLAESERQLFLAVADADNEGSLASVIKNALRVGRVGRDRISMDTWRVLASLDQDIDGFARFRRGGRLGNLVDLLNDVVVTLAAFSGLAIDSMTRGQAFHFLDMGRRLERAVTLATLLRATLTNSLEREAPLLEAVLDIADSGMTYRRRYLAQVQPAPVVDLLLGDETNPRSVMYQVSALVEHIRALPPLPGSGTRSPQLRLALSVQNEIELCVIERVCEPDATGSRPMLEALLRKCAIDLAGLSDSLSDSYLYHASVSRHLSGDVATRTTGGDA